VGYKRKSSASPPTWLVLLIAVALVFGGFYLIQGAQIFLRTGGLGAEEATARARITASAVTQVGFTPIVTLPSAVRITATPAIACVPFVVVVPNAIVREQASANGAIIRGISSGEEVCVIGRAGDPDWYLIDLNPETRRIDEAFMSDEVIEPLNPSPTPSDTVTALPTVTRAPVTDTPQVSDTPVAENTARDDDPTATRTPRRTATADTNAQPTIPPTGG
jgi:hypothetical protein